MITHLVRTRLLGDALVGNTLAGHWRGGVGLLIRNANYHGANVAILVSGFVEPLLYLLSLGVGMGQLVDQVTYRGIALDYAVFVAPAMLATAAMNGTVTETTYNFFSKLKFMKLYHGIIATPVTPLGIVLGEVAWAVVRGAMYAACFVIVMAAMGLTPSWWAIAAFPAAVLIGLAFATVGLALTTYMRSWQDFDYIAVSTFLLLLFSGTFAPLDVYPTWLQVIIMATPLYHGVELIRGLTTGMVSVGLWGHVAYLLVVSAAGLVVAGGRMRRLLTP